MPKSPRMLKLQAFLHSHPQRWRMAFINQFGLTLVAFFLLSLPSLARGADKLVFVTWDGFRWQEMFAGADESLMNKDVGGVPEVDPLKTAFWRDSPEQRRQILLPFVWNVLAKQGQLFGDPSRQSPATITNGLKFSYPGYNEMFVGYADAGIRSNAKIHNPNINVLEYIQRQPGFSGKVAAFATWDVIEFVLNRPRAGFPVVCGWTPVSDQPLTAGQQQVNEMVRDLPRIWRGNAFDIVTQTAAREHLAKHRPHVLYIGMGETDEWAHARRYDLYLESAQRCDRYLSELWDWLQSQPEYRGQTTLVLTTDHGRGTGRDWANHGANIVGAEFVWMGLLGPQIPALGVRENTAATQSQIAATLAQLVGVDYATAFPQAAPPLKLR